jgi:hypothetical protein
MSKYVVTTPGQTDQTIDELQKRAKKYLKYERISNALIFLLICLIIGSAMVANYLENWSGVPLLSKWSGLVISLDVVIFGAFGALVIRKKSEYYLNTDEWAKFYAYSIATNVGKYLDTESSGMKKSYKKESLEDAKGFLSCVEEKWTVGNLKPSKEFVGTAIEDLKKNLRYRMIPAIRSEDRDLLRKISQDMSQLVIFSNSLSIESIKQINTWMSQLPNREPLGKTYFSRMLIFAKNHQPVKHSVVVLALGLLSFVVGYVAFTSGASIDASWIIGATLFAASVTIYFLKQPKSEK